MENIQQRSQTRKNHPAQRRGKQSESPIQFLRSHNKRVKTHAERRRKKHNHRLTSQKQPREKLPQPHSNAPHMANARTKQNRHLRNHRLRTHPTRSSCAREKPHIPPNNQRNHRTGIRKHPRDTGKTPQHIKPRHACTLRIHRNRNRHPHPVETQQTQT